MLSILVSGTLALTGAILPALNDFKFEAAGSKLGIGMLVAAFVIASLPEFKRRLGVKVWKSDARRTKRSIERTAAARRAQMKSVD